ncbi:hypothetical protein [Amycolatopsis azurea]|uniref:Uncharacterized protein n=1 Tax=Amycolatopsis azurea DSM 43854 TaxID=1238180 RepID=A0ABX3J079_9PSEU|nr:hypothetical protein [Amycolatopsis azurea]OOC00569.1 hypothetical protein B0293_42490 [Amycolatopsis azurea DSM 43854]
MNTDEKYQEELDYFTEYTQGDWVPINYIFVSASNLLGAGASLRQITDVAEGMFKDLFARNVCIGDLTAHDPGFEAWQGTPGEWLERIREDVEKRGDIPDPGEFGWLHTVR